MSIFRTFVGIKAWCQFEGLGVNRTKSKLLFTLDRTIQPGAFNWLKFQLYTSSTQNISLRKSTEFPTITFQLYSYTLWNINTLQDKSRGSKFLPTNLMLSYSKSTIFYYKDFLPLENSKALCNSKPCSTRWDNIQSSKSSDFFFKFLFGSQH